MQCTKCAQKVNLLCSKCFTTTTQSKKQEKIALRQQLKQKQTNIDLFMTQCSQKSQVKGFLKRKDQEFSLQANIKKMQQKMAFTKQKIKQLQQKRQRLGEDTQELRSRREKIGDSNKQALQAINQSEGIYNFNKQSWKICQEKVSFYSKQLCEDLTIIACKLYPNFIKFEKKRLFEIKKVEELDFSSNQSLEESYYSVENLEEISTKQKTNERGLHILLQNILVMAVICDTFRIWLPYPIELPSTISNYSQFSGFKTKVEDMAIFKHHLIDYGHSNQLTQNIVQFFPSRLAGDPFSSALKSKDALCQIQEEQEFQNFIPNEDAQFNKRRISLNKVFINYMQANVEYLGLKHCVSFRPLIFLDQNGISSIISQSRAALFKHSGPQSFPQSRVQNPNGCFEKPARGFKTMLKKLKLYKYLEAVSQNQLQTSDNIPSTCGINLEFRKDQSEQVQRVSFDEKSQKNKSEKGDNVELEEQIPDALVIIKSDEFEDLELI